MNKRAYWLVFIFLVGLGGISFLVRPRSKPVIQANLQSGPDSIGHFERVTGPAPLRFPLDLGAHPAFQTEWWYYTGNLTAATGEEFGYQLTFFRRALVGSDQRQERGSDWAVEQVYLANFALTDGNRGRFVAYQRMERGAAGLAGVEITPALRVWLHDWSVQADGSTQFHLTAKEGGDHIDLILEDGKGILLQGDQGYSRKGPEEGNASIYFSQTRLATRGSLETGGKSYWVGGDSWMDHEYSTSALSVGQVGWDWFALQLDDGSELMVYAIRREDGSMDPYSQGSVIYPDGSTRLLHPADFHITVQDIWTSPVSGGKYPAQWTVSVPSEDLELQVQPLLADQELNLSFVYWEGAVRITGTRDGLPIRGKGYVELTGYAQSLEDRF